MNDKQHNLLIWAAAVLVGMVLYPPFIFVGANGITLNMGYSWLFDPPIVNPTTKYTSTVNIPLLITQELVAAVAFGAVYVSLSRKQSA